MYHTYYTISLYDRMTLEDIHQVWVQQTSQGGDKDGGETAEKDYSHRQHGLPRRQPDQGQTAPNTTTTAGKTTTAVTMLLPSFLQAFEDLARAKYAHCGQRWEGRGGSVSLLLLSDVLNSITGPGAANTKVSIIRASFCRTYCLCIYSL